MSPAPTDKHQEIVGRLFVLLTNFVDQHDLGKTRIAPYDVYLDQRNAFQPDIVFISKERLHLIQHDGLHGAPDLVIEILSPGTAKYDQKKKRNVYERYGVLEHWIIDPDTRAVQGFRLVNHRFEPLAAAPGQLPSSLLQTTFSF